MALGAGVPWSAGLVRFANGMPQYVADPTTPTDAIVVLTGGSERVVTGLRLLAEAKAQRVFISGVHPSVDVDRLLKVSNRPAGSLPVNSLETRVETGHGALDTEGNAEETAAWMRQRGYHSLRLVTSAYHMPRSLLEFRQALPDAVVIPHPVFPENVKQRSWWLRPGSAALIISEYNKYLITSVLYWAMPRLSAAGRLREHG